MKIECIGCKEKLKEQGALVFEPPKHGLTLKHHICKHCWIKFVKEMSSMIDG